MTAAEVSAPFGEARFVVTDAAYGTQAQVDQAAKALAERIAGSFAELEAVIRGNPEVRAGSAVALNAVGAPFEGRYTVTTSRHVFDAVRGYETWITVSGQQERSLYGLASNSVSSPMGSRCAGLVSGTVTDTQDPEGSGRVKVRFPWLSDEYASDWARTAQANGTGGGEAFIPEVGDEVLVGFEHGHLDRPYVLAGLYNGQDRPGGRGRGAALPGPSVVLPGPSVVLPDRPVAVPGRPVAPRGRPVVLPGRPGVPSVPPHGGCRGRLRGWRRRTRRSHQRRRQPPCLRLPQR